MSTAVEQKMCNGPGNCMYRTYTNSGWGCSYIGHCIHQCPQSSSNQILYTSNSNPDLTEILNVLREILAELKRRV